MLDGCYQGEKFEEVLTGSDGQVGKRIDSTSDARTVNNVMRHEYKVLSEYKKEQMKTVKDMGLAFHEYLTAIGDDREIWIAKEKIEEATMWAVKSLTK